MVGLGKRPLIEQEFDAVSILGRAAAEANLIAEHLQEEGEAALMSNLYNQASQARETLTKENLSDEELLASVGAVAQSIMTALEAASYKDKIYHLRNIIRGDHMDPADKAEEMEDLNQMFTQATPAFPILVLSGTECEECMKALVTCFPCMA
ncbi:g11569 [Coccomyxa viridis]|uniref:G11569 protein n=1 Tax=Coccomyxa viridis TaxID=1274662 RepID=A0ABP1GAY6_9CHLO